MSLTFHFRVLRLAVYIEFSKSSFSLTRISRSCPLACALPGLHLRTPLSALTSHNLLSGVSGQVSHDKWGNIKLIIPVPGGWLLPCWRWRRQQQRQAVSVVAVMVVVKVMINEVVVVLMIALGVIKYCKWWWWYKKKSAHVITKVMSNDRTWQYEGNKTVTEMDSSSPPCMHITDWSPCCSLDFNATADSNPIIYHQNHWLKLSLTSSRTWHA